MKIVFPEYHNSTIQAALQVCPEIEAVEAKDLQEACEILMSGAADGMVAGIEATTREVLLACRENIPTAGKYFTSSFLMEKDGRRLMMADGGVCKKPDFAMLTQVVLQTYETALKILDETPRIAMLSFSTFGSGGKDDSVDLIRDVINEVHNLKPEIIIEGEMQLDVAVNPEIAAQKSLNSKVAGRANVLICPDLNSGNILYKGLEQLGGWTMAGPLLQGFIKPISDLSRGSTVEDTVLVIKTLEKLIV